MFFVDAGEEFEIRIVFAAFFADGTSFSKCLPRKTFTYMQPYRTDALRVQALRRGKNQLLLIFLIYIDGAYIRVHVSSDHLDDLLQKRLDRCRVGKYPTQLTYIAQ